MKIALISLAALSLAGCAELDSAATEFTTFVNKPETQQTISSVRTATATIACILQTTQGKKTTAYVVERDACLLAGGSLR